MRKKALKIIKTMFFSNLFFPVPKCDINHKLMRSFSAEALLSSSASLFFFFFLQLGPGKSPPCRLCAALFVVVVLTTTRQSFMIPPRSQDDPRGQELTKPAATASCLALNEGEGEMISSKSLICQIIDDPPTFSGSQRNPETTTTSGRRLISAGVSRCQRVLPCVRRIWARERQPGCQSARRKESISADKA